MSPEEQQPGPENDASISGERRSAQGAARTQSRKVRGVVYLNPSRCKGCGFCIAFCPPKVLAFSSEFNAQGYHPPRLVNPDGCTGCDLCGLYCPDFAIYGVILKYPATPAESTPEPEGEQP